MKSECGEFYFLKLKPGYPKSVKAVAIAHLEYDTETRRLYFDRPGGFQWVASMWILDEDCQIDLAVVLKEDNLEFIEGYCHHGEECPKVERVKQAILGSDAFSQIREDLIQELFRREVAALHRA